MPKPLVEHVKYHIGLVNKCKVHAGGHESFEALIATSFTFPVTLGSI
jgi:hypothetical protein